ncbi:MAG: hypothetical protein PHQ05_02550 [Sterolibacterium sp.]|nr:hypothetical protein [Sterolibacterium sp.]
MAKVSSKELERLQGMDAKAVLLRLTGYAKPDPSFRPIRSKHTTRWHVRVNSSEFELLVCGPKFYDTRQKRGGGGAIDLVMHLYRIEFQKAVEILRGVL